MNKIKKFLCGLTGHNWTSTAMEDLPPTKKQLEDGADGFFDYAKMYCRRCQCISKLNTRNGEQRK